MCSACIKKKRDYILEKVNFKTRNGDRLKNPTSDWDSIDEEALVVFSMQNMTFPVEVEGDIL